MDDLTEHLTERYRAWFGAITATGIDGLPEFLADEWRYTNYDGVVRSRAEYLDWVAEQGPGPTFVGPFDVEVTRPGGLALVLGRYHVEHANGESLALRFTGLWEQREGRWQCLMHHNSEVAGA